RKQAAHRDAALADLEGRNPSPHRVPRLRPNFMSLSEDEEEDDPKPARRSTLAVCRAPAHRQRRSTVASLLAPLSPSARRRAKRLSAASWFASFLDLDLRDDDGAARLGLAVVRAA
ncbi:hypothetical protein K488DRAFT_75356, partial [Vararia minispora EC-137]